MQGTIERKAHGSFLETFADEIQKGRSVIVLLLLYPVTEGLETRISPCGKVDISQIPAEKSWLGIYCILRKGGCLDVLKHPFRRQLYPYNNKKSTQIVNDGYVSL